MSKDIQEAKPAEEITSATQLSPENPLVIERIKRNVEGGVDINLALSKVQTYVLLEFAIMMLTAQGLAIIQDVEAKGDVEQAADEIVLGEQVH